MLLKRLLTIMVLILSISVFSACESKGPAEKAGEKIDQVVEKTTDKAKEVTDDVKEKAEEAGKEVKKSTQ
jgi:polyhydroxyalkanoate synthesis regulator phasin